jgi:hypothetical protein
MENDIKQENEKKKEYLRQYGCALRTERAIEEEIQQVRLDKMFPALVQDGMPHGSGGNSDLSAFVVKVDELLAELKKQAEKRITLRQGIVRKIEQMDDETEKLVLRLRYIQLLKWEEVAVKMDYDYRYVLKVHGRALKNFEI